MDRRVSGAAWVFVPVFVVFVGACTSGDGADVTSSTTTAVTAVADTTPTSGPGGDVVEPEITAIPEPEGRMIVVASSADSGPLTLRQALLDARPHDTISFDSSAFPTDAPRTVAITSELPPLGQGDLTIDASDAGVILDGAGIPRDDETGCLVVASNGNTIQGLHIINFPGAGLRLDPGSRDNTIGGYQSIGNDPLEQGNVLSGNGLGIILIGASGNSIQGNYIGTNMAGTLGLGNRYQGILVQDGRSNEIVGNVIVDNGASGVTILGRGAEDNSLRENAIGTDSTETRLMGNHNHGIELRDGASRNVIGPGNVVVHNDWSGIDVYGAGSLSNTIARNRIHGNGWLGIDVWGGANAGSSRPVLTAFDLAAGALKGLARPNVEIEVFSTDGDEGDVFEGSVVTDESGFFAYERGEAFSGPHLVATATDSAGNTGEFSLPTHGDAGSLRMQPENPRPVSLLTARQSSDLEDNRIASFWHSLWAYSPLSELLDEARYVGATRFRFGINGGEADKVDWGKPEFSIDPDHDRFISHLAENGMQLTVNLTFWDLATWPGGVGAPCPRFKTEEDIQHYLEYVRFIVRHFKDRVQTYEIWNEPDNTACPQWIRPHDYVTLVRRAVPVIREEYPDAKVQVGSIILAGFHSESYLFTILRSDIMPLVDVIGWHPFYGDSPEHNADYYHAYPSLVREIMDVAHSHGFTGEFEASEMNWRPHSHPLDDPNRRHYGELAYAKYWLRGILMNLGLDITAGNLRIEHSAATAFWAVRHLATVMAGHRLADIPLSVQGELPDIQHYGFALPDGDNLVALWIDGIAVDDDPGIPSTLVFPGRAGQRAVGIDVLNGYEQQLVTTDEADDLVIPDLIVRDYPIIIRLEG